MRDREWGLERDGGVGVYGCDVLSSGTKREGASETSSTLFNFSLNSTHDRLKRSIFLCTMVGCAHRVLRVL